jgi:hypothetical protein
MKQECLPVVKPTIEEIQEQFIVWRNNRRCRESVPDALWEAAVSLAEDYSIGHICKVLGLNHRQLKRKIQDHSVNGHPQEGRSCHFVELAVSEPESEAVSEPESEAISELAAISSPEPDVMSKPESNTEYVTEYVMEMEDPKGGKLRVHIKGGAGFNLLEMAKAFWGRDK